MLSKGTQWFRRNSKVNILDVLLLRYCRELLLLGAARFDRDEANVGSLEGWESFDAMSRPTCCRLRLADAAQALASTKTKVETRILAQERQNGAELRGWKWSRQREWKSTSSKKGVHSLVELVCACLLRVSHVKLRSQLGGCTRPMTHHTGMLPSLLGERMLA